MPGRDLWTYMLSAEFLIPFGIVLAFFLPLLWSVWITWKENADKVHTELDDARTELEEPQRRVLQVYVPEQLPETAESGSD